MTCISPSSMAWSDPPEGESFFLKRMVVSPSASNPTAAVRSSSPPQRSVSRRGVDLGGGELKGFFHKN